MNKPLTTEHPPYYQKYIDLVPEGNLVTELEQQKQNALTFFEKLTEEKGNYAYAPEKWSIKEVLCHIIDTERIFSYRALRFARGDQQILPGYDQDEYIKHAQANGRSLKSLIAEYEAVRNSSIELIKSFGEKELVRLGKANNMDVSVKAITYMIAGHELHHMQVLKERYL